jgi:hypothetical protein
VFMEAVKESENEEKQCRCRVVSRLGQERVPPDAEALSGMPSAIACNDIIGRFVTVSPPVGVASSPYLKQVHPSSSPLSASSVNCFKQTATVLRPNVSRVSGIQRL